MIRWRECREQRDEEFRLREQQGLSPRATTKDSLSGEEEEGDGGRTLPEMWEPSPPSPRAAEAAEETAPRVGAGASAARQPTREATRAAGTTGGAAVAMPASVTMPAEPPRKRK
jgi:hypothetical protein